MHRDRGSTYKICRGGVRCRAASQRALHLSRIREGARPGNARERCRRHVRQARPSMLFPLPAAHGSKQRLAFRLRGERLRCALAAPAQASTLRSENDQATFTRTHSARIDAPNVVVGSTSRSSAGVTTVISSETGTRTARSTSVLRSQRDSFVSRTMSTSRSLVGPTLPFANEPTTKISRMLGAPRAAYAIRFHRQHRSRALREFREAPNGC